MTRKRARESQESSRDLYYTKNNVSSRVPPKTDVMKQLDKEWAKDLPKELSRDQKEYLLSLKNQAERNRELSSMMTPQSSSRVNAPSSLAVLQHRKSHLRKSARQMNTARDMNMRNCLDQIHYKQYNETHRLESMKRDEEEMNYPVHSNKPKADNTPKKNVLDIVSYIRARGEKAKVSGTPQSKNKRTPVPFPDMFSDEKKAQEPEIITEIQKAPVPEDIPVEEEIPIIEEKITEAPVHKHESIKRLEPEVEPVAIIEKVQTQHKDISVPVVTEIQPKPLVDSSFDMKVMTPTRSLSKLTPTPLQGKQLVDSIKMNIGNLRSPAKITNRMILPVEETSLQPIMESDSEFKTPLPKKPKSVARSEADEISKELVTTFPMRSDFNMTPKEYDDILLPKKLQLIFDFFTELDNAINNCKRRGKIPVLSNLKPYIEQATNRSFDIEHFRRVFYVAPELYYYKWQPTQGAGNFELRIEVPQNIEEIINKIHKKGTTVEVKHIPLSEPMTNFTTNKRKIIVKTRLIIYINSLHKEYLNKHHISSLDFNALKGWHKGFDIENIMDLPKKTLKDIPKGRRSESTSEFLKKTNIRSSLLRKQVELAKKDSSEEMSHHHQSTNPSSMMNA